MSTVVKLKEGTKLEFAQAATSEGKRERIIRTLKSESIEKLPVSDGTDIAKVLILRNDRNEMADKGISGAVNLLNQQMSAAGSNVRFAKRAAVPAETGWWHTVIYRIS